jgi:hypothetical protein
MYKIIFDFVELILIFIDNSRFEQTPTDATNATSVVIIGSIHVSNHCFHYQTSVSCNHAVWSVITVIIRFVTKNKRHVIRTRDDFYFDLKSSIIIIDNVLFIRFLFIIERFWSRWINRIILIRRILRANSMMLVIRVSQAAIQKQDCGITWCDYSHVMWLRWLCIERDNFDSSISTYIENRSS